MKNKRMIISIIISVFIIGVFFFLYQQNYNKNKGLESFGITERNIIAKISNGKDLDIFTRDGSNLSFYVFEKSSKNNNYEEKISIKSKYLFDYNARKKVEESEKSSSVDFIKDDLEATSTIYRGSDISLSRNPYCGVSISPKIKKLKVNNKPVDRVIEYTYNDRVFYIWYFYDLKIDSNNIEVRW